MDGRKRGSNTCRTTGGEKEREREVGGRERESSRFSHVTADAPIRVRSTDSPSSSYHGKAEEISYRNGCGEMTWKIGGNAPSARCNAFFPPPGLSLSL